MRIDLRHSQFCALEAAAAGALCTSPGDPCPALALEIRVSGRGRGEGGVPELSHSSHPALLFQHCGFFEM